MFTLRPRDVRKEEVEVTHTVLLPPNRSFRKLEADNLKIEVLKDNTELLNVALEDMRLRREEQKRKLNER